MSLINSPRKTNNSVDSGIPEGTQEKEKVNSMLQSMLKLARNYCQSQSKNGESIALSSGVPGEWEVL